MPGRFLVCRMIPARLMASGIRIVLATALFVGSTTMTAVAAGPAAEDEKNRVSTQIYQDFRSPFLCARQDALDALVRQGEVAVPVLVPLLRDSDHRVRTLAIRGLSRLHFTTARQALLLRLTEERDPRLIDAIADALVPYGSEAWAVIRTRARSTQATDADRRAYRRFLWQYVVSLIHRNLCENTDATGQFKGFYDGQFAAVGEIGSEAGDVLLRMVLDQERFPISIRQFAVRALAEVGTARHVPALKKFHDDLLGSYGPDDRFRSMSSNEEDKVMQQFARRVLARLGEPEPCRKQIRYYEEKIGMNRRYRNEYAGPYQYDLAYEWHQIRDYEKAMKAYHRYLENYSVAELRHYNDRYLAWYNLACIASKLNQQQKALYYLARAFQENYTDFQWLELDRDLDNIRNLPEYKKLVAAQKAKFLATDK